MKCLYKTQFRRKAKQPKEDIKRIFVEKQNNQKKIDQKKNEEEFK